MIRLCERFVMQDCILVNGLRNVMARVMFLGVLLKLPSCMTKPSGSFTVTSLAGQTELSSRIFQEEPGFSPLSSGTY